MCAPRGLQRQISRFGIEPTTNSFDRNGLVSVFLMGSLPPVAGSAVTVLLVVFMIWAAICLVRGTFPYRLEPSDRILAWTFTAFAAVIVLTSLLGEDRQDIAAASLWIVKFLAPWVVISRLRASPKIDYLKAYILGAAIGCIGALAMGLGESVLTPGERPSGGAGNAAIFAMVCLCLTGFAALGLSSKNRRTRLLASAGTLSGILAIILSGTRGVAMLLPAIFLIVALYSRGNWQPLARRRALIILAGLTAIVLVAASDLIILRVDETMDEIHSLVATGHSGSIGERLRLWHASILAIAESPVWGYGIQNRMDAVIQYLSDFGTQDAYYTHPHNAFLAALLDGGIIALAGLIAVLSVPVVIAWRAPRDDEDYRPRLYLALILTTSYALTGMTQIMFKHDIMDSFFIATALYISASIPATKER